MNQSSGGAGGEHPAAADGSFSRRELHPSPARAEARSTGLRAWPASRRKPRRRPQSGRDRRSSEMSHSSRASSPLPKPKLAGRNSSRASAQSRWAVSSHASPGGSERATKIRTALSEPPSLDSG